MTLEHGQTYEWVRHGASEGLIVHMIREEDPVRYRGAWRVLVIMPHSNGWSSAGDIKTYQMDLDGWRLVG